MWLYLALAATQLLCGGWILPLAKSQLSPEESRLIFHTLPPERVSLFGSEADGRCSSTSVMNNMNVCNGTSVLNDGVTPTLYGVSEDPLSEWASQLFTMRRNGTDTISLTFQLTPGVNRDRVEVAVFNCPQRRIYAPSIGVYSNFQLLPQTRTIITNKTVQNTSCNHLIKFCLDFNSATTLRFFTLEFPYETDSDYVFLGEVSFFNGESSSCDAPELINATTYPPSPFTSSHTSDQSTSTTQDTTPPQNPIPARGKGTPTTIIVIIIVVLLLVAIAVVSVAMVMFMMFMRRRKRKRDEDKVQQLQNVVMETKVGEKVGAGLTNICYENVGNTLSTKGSDSNDADLLDGVYSIPDEVKNDTYNRLGGKEKEGLTHGSAPVGDDQYSKLNLVETSLFASSTAAKLSPSPPLSSLPPDVGDMYAVPDTKKRTPSSPAVPQKSAELVEYLETKEAMTINDEEIVESAPEYSEIGNGSAGPVMKSIAASHSMLNGMSSNPLYQSAELNPSRALSLSSHFNTAALDTNPIYAEPEPPNMHEPEWDPDKNIYESIYNEPLNPSLFMRKRESVNSEDLCPYSSIYSLPVVPTATAKPLSVSISSIREIKHLGNGNFGQVVLAQTVGLSPRDLQLEGETPYTIVAVKKLKPSASTRNRELFDKEVKFMSRLNHPNVIRLLGVCTDEAAPFIMMEYMTNGDLNQYLNEFGSIGEGEAKSISTSRLVYISTQIASAMQYLASQNFIHRDLATRNCLVGSKDTIKIADFGMSRSLYESQYYVISGHAILPIRWMATECFFGKFSAKTDVWAFGVTLWEIFTLAKDPPYDNLEDSEIVKDAIKGADRSLLEQPRDCPENVYEIMRKCWVHEASERPTFDELHELLIMS